jgi:high-affinity iron transporter
MIPTFVIFLREGVEASMIVAILLSYLDQIGQRRHFRDVFWGVAVAMVLMLAGGVTAYLLIHRYAGSTTQAVFETVTYLLAAVVLTYMTFWMQAHSRTMKSELVARSEAALEGRARWGLRLLAFQAVGREGLETMVFTLAIVFASTSQAGTPVAGRALLFGAVLGLALALAIAYVVFRLGKRLILGLFFRVIGIVLMVFAAGLLADAVQNMQQLGWLPFLDRPMWDTSGYLSQSSNIGDAFHSFLGYADHPTVLQAVVWVGYLVAATTTFIVMGRRGSRPAPVESGGQGVAPAAPAAPDGVAAAAPFPAPVAGSAPTPSPVPEPSHGSGTRTLADGPRG